MGVVAKAKRCNYMVIQGVKAATINIVIILILFESTAKNKRFTDKYDSVPVLGKNPF